MKFTPEKPQQLMIDMLLTSPLVFAMVGMGIGKTAGCLKAITDLYQSLELSAVLVIAPVRVCNLTWPLEVERWDDFKWIRVANLRTQLGRRAFIAGAAHIYLINFESIPLLKKLVDKRGGEVPYDTVIFDESTKLKSHNGKRAAVFRNEIPAVKRRWALTGTPAPNSLMDLWNQVRMLDDGQRLGRSFEQFKRGMFHPTDYQEYKWEANDDAKQKIEERISDITITLRSSDWLKDVPDAAINDVEINMPADLLDKYYTFEEELILELQNSVEITAPNAAALVSKLLQFTSGALYDENKAVHVVHDLKLKALAKIVKETKGPVLVACAFQHEQARIRRAFPQARFFADATTPALQVQLLAQWNRREIPMLVAHPASCGHGLNMQQGSKTMVWMTLTYSRESYEQMIARLVRRGQHEVVTVHRLMCPGTADDVVAEVLQSKRATEQSLLSALMMLESARGVLTPEKLKVKRPAEAKPKDEDDWL